MAIVGNNSMGGALGSAIKQTDDDLLKKELLERCVGGFTQNNNESDNGLIWKITPKHLSGGAVPVQIAAHTSACIFNEGETSQVKILETLKSALWLKLSRLCELIAERHAQATTREGRMARRQTQIDVSEAETDAEGLLYVAGIDDSM
ncbi:unnamed protein product [Euphydryas editha]|uniref:Uncharacterized protein n=1 Tax=Euphydryas editha TaxID=104508 RepID=A0AAU9U2X1_EUPED|nr:unnamed protein product [Euphydryas editha]